MKTPALLLLVVAAVALASVSAFRLPAAPSPRLAPVLHKASSLLQQQQRSALQLPKQQPWGALKAAAASGEGALKNWDPQRTW